MKPEHCNPPHWFDLFSELPRATVESLQLLQGYRQLVKQSPKGHHQPVVCISGYGGNDSSTYLLRKFLEDVGYRSYKADIGTIMEDTGDSMRGIDGAIAFRTRMAERITERIDDIYTQTQEPVNLIGWSLGGLIAFDAAHSLPDKVGQVITMGSPFGDLRNVSVFPLICWLKNNRTPIDEAGFTHWDALRSVRNSALKIHVIYSEKDGVVSTAAIRLAPCNNVTYHQINSSHVGFSVNTRVFSAISDLLAASQ